ncbi:hypothetical protein UCDDS831_g08194 [Diplodia seriata]|uniref:Uncharacterized protein n=1 Tax=Diplodia seriata TaxID=420778 RepID=A0A0G2DV56_9PEZI|nr:hypothetical protein UCDDS831_g08194 [Diplodia seriata]
MGLPIWRAPSPADHRAQAVKNDASAATRSPIRRSSPASSRPAGRIPGRSDANGYTRRYINVAELITRRANGREADRRSQERRTADLSSMADDWLSDLDRLAPIASESREQTRSPEDRVHLYISTDGPSIRASRFGPNHPENSPFSRSRPAAHERESSLYRENSSGVERSFENRRDSGVGSDAANTSSSGGDGASGRNRVSTPALTDFADILDRVAERQPQMDPELESMRDILGRLARRDDVPEEFWTGAGLVPPMPEGTPPRREQRERAWDEA